MVWLGIDNDRPLLRSWGTVIFSLFSHVFWPIFVPFAILLVETGRRRRRAIGVFQAMGLGVGLYLLYFLLRYPITARVEGRSIFYDAQHLYIVGALVIYLPATCVSGLFSSHRCINAFGVLAFVLAIAAYQVSVKTFVSVQCFYAAILSLLIYLHFNGPMQRSRTRRASSDERDIRPATARGQATRGRGPPSRRPGFRSFPHQRSWSPADALRDDQSRRWNRPVRAATRPVDTRGPP